mmetsp:Transcript_60369/g.179379  ORF Transcript_60369/g.179379 Transcript_60369/m.179379 type:complete len:227 (-) Transcript_60369:268-948(-)
MARQSNSGLLGPPWPPLGSGARPMMRSSEERDELTSRASQSGPPCTDISCRASIASIHHSKVRPATHAWLRAESERRPRRPMRKRSTRSSLLPGQGITHRSSTSTGTPSAIRWHCPPCCAPGTSDSDTLRTATLGAAAKAGFAAVGLVGLGCTAAVAAAAAAASAEAAWAEAEASAVVGISVGSCCKRRECKIDEWRSLSCEPVSRPPLSFAPVMYAESQGARTSS